MWKGDPWKQIHIFSLQTYTYIFKYCGVYLIILTGYQIKNNSTISAHIPSHTSNDVIEVDFSLTLVKE